MSKIYACLFCNATANHAKKMRGKKEYGSISLDSAARIEVNREEDEREREREKIPVQN